MTDSECISKWADGENNTLLSPEVTCYLLEPREASFHQGNPPGWRCFTQLLGGPEGPWVTRASACLFSGAGASPGSVLCLFASSFHQGCFCVSVNKVTLLQEQPHIDTPRPTRGNDCWLDWGLFPPSMQFEAGGVVRRPLRHLRFSMLRVTVQTEENDSFHHFLLNDSVLIQLVSTPQQRDEENEKRKKKERSRIEEHMLITDSEVLLQMNPFSFTQKNPCYLLQGHKAAPKKNLLWSLSLPYLFPF